MTGFIDYDWLLSHADNPQDGLVRAFAGAIHNASRREGVGAPNLAMGLGSERFIELLDRYFPGASGLLHAQSCATPCDECVQLRADEFDDLVQLLLAHRSDAGEQTEWLAYAIASGCMGGNHLYQDMGLPDRQALSDLLNRHFTALFVKNVGNMKWKKFFYKQLCERAEVKACSAPSCQVCQDFNACFGPEDDTGLGRLAAIGQQRAPLPAPAAAPDWLLANLPDDYLAQVILPCRYERFQEAPVQAYKLLGYDLNGDCCYHQRHFVLDRELLDDEDNFSEDDRYFEEVKAWRLTSGDWLRCTIQAGCAGDCRSRSLRPAYAIVSNRPD